MALAVVCPACGRRFRVEERLAGKRLRCRCGQRLEIHRSGQADPSPLAPARPEEDDDWVAAAFAAPEPPAPQESHHPQEPLPVPEPLSVAQQDPPGTWTSPVSGPADTSGEAPRDLLRHLQAAIAPAVKRRSKAAMQRLAVAGLAMAYGSVMALVLAVRLFLYPPAGIFALSNRLAAVVLAGCVAVGGWLILRRHPQGPAWAGLASMFLCFPTAWSLLMKALGDYSAGQWRWLGAVLLHGALLLTIPGLIVAWCLKSELARQQRERQREEEEHSF